jgi:hypothetical protein
MKRRTFLGLLACAGQVHGQARGQPGGNPRLFFSAADVDGLRQKIRTAPTSNWYASLKSSLRSAQSYTGTDEDTRSKYARDMAFVYLMEGGDAWRSKTLEFLLAVGDYDTDWITFGWTWGGDLLFYAMAYDWIQPALATVDDEAVKAKLEAASDRTFGKYTVPPITGSDKYYTNVRLRVAAGLGAASLALRDYGNAWARLDWVVEDLFGQSHTCRTSSAAWWRRTASTWKVALTRTTASRHWLRFCWHTGGTRAWTGSRVAGGTTTGCGRCSRQTFN